MVDVRCPNCNTSFVVGDDCNAVKHIKDGISYLVPSVVRNDNLGETTMNEKAKERMAALKEVGIDVSKLQALMSKDSSLKDIFTDDNDPILEEIGKRGFLRNPELFRRWICAQTFSLLRNPYGWTHAVRKAHDTRYVFKQTKDELKTLVHLYDKGLYGKDIRFDFFTLQDLKRIFVELLKDERVCLGRTEKSHLKECIWNCSGYKELLVVVTSDRWYIGRSVKHLPKTWLNCFKGAGAYYTLMNIIKTHDFVIPSCKDEEESEALVNKVFNEIKSYEPSDRRWDILMSLLTSSVKKTNFELKW